MSGETFAAKHRDMMVTPQDIANEIMSILGRVDRLEGAAHKPQAVIEPVTMPCFKTDSLGSLLVHYALAYNSNDCANPITEGVKAEIDRRIEAAKAESVKHEPEPYPNYLGLCRLCGCAVYDTDARCTESSGSIHVRCHNAEIKVWATMKELL